MCFFSPLCTVVYFDYICVGKASSSSWAGCHAILASRRPVYGHFMTFIHAQSWRLSILRASPMAGHSCCASSFMLAPASPVTFVCVALDAAVGFAYGTTDGQPPQCGIGWWAGRKSRLYRSPPYTALVLEALLHHTHTHTPFILCLPLFRPVSVFLFFLLHDSWRDRIFLFLLPLNYIFTRIITK